VINWLLGTTIGRWVLAGAAALVLFAAVAARYYFKGKDAAKADALEATLKNVAKGLQARIDERRNPTDEDTDPFNRDNRNRPGR
jgi:hypothetical protein